LGDEPWTTAAPSAPAHASHYAQPAALDEGGIERVRDAFARAARRALNAGFEVVELHCGHGYLLNQFLSPVANKRTDAYGGSLENRMRLPLQIARDLRQIWPADWPVLVRVSATDHIDGGWTLEDTFFLAAELKASGIDMIDCSSGGFDGAAQNAFSAYHVPFAESIAQATGIRTMAAGLIRASHEAEAAVRDHCVDLVGLARGALMDPNWPLRAYMELKGATGEPPPWPKQSGWAL